jgi:predicted ATPase
MSPTPPSDALAAVRAAKAELLRQVGQHDDVVGIGITRHADGFALKVNLAKAGSDAAIPHEVLGVRVIQEVVGSIRAGPR